MYKGHCFLIYGTTRQGVHHPKFLIDGDEVVGNIDDMLSSYRHMHPDVVHIRLDIAFPDGSKQ